LGALSARAGSGIVVAGHSPPGLLAMVEAKGGVSAVTLIAAKIPETTLATEANK
jgi:hypothetical protein